MLALAVACIKIMVRDRLSLFWGIVFPLIFVGVFSLFDLDRPPEVKVALVDAARSPFTQELREAMASNELFKVEEAGNAAQALRDLRNGDYGLVVMLPPNVGEEPGVTARAYYSETNVQVNQMALAALRRFFDEFNLQAANVQPLVAVEAQPIKARDVGFMDFLVPGILGMAVMQYGILGMATILVDYREKRILRRIQTTPIPVGAFVIAQMAAYMLMALIQSGIILGAGTAVGAELPPNFFWVFPLALLGDVVFLGLGVAVARVCKTTAAAAGMGNAVTMPMMFLSGVFFPLDQLPKVLGKVMEFSPLALLLDSLRSILLERNPVSTVWDEVVLLALWAMAVTVLAAKSLRVE